MTRQQVRRAVAEAFSYKITENVRAAYPGSSKHGLGSNLGLLPGTAARIACALALLLAGAGEAVIRTGHSFWLSLGLYLAAAGVLLPGAFPPLPVREEEAGERSRTRRAALAICLAVPVLMGALGLRALWAENQAVAARLWVASMALILVGACLLGRSLDVPARWGVARLPRTRAARIAALAVLAAILTVAVATRLWGLGRIPYGVNPDEGDQAALAIQIARGFNTDPIFGFGWYHLSMVYFKLLAAVTALVGLDVAGVRVLGALCGIATVGLVTAAGIRHFGLRAGILSGALLAAMGGAIQFSRMTTVASPTQTLWALSAFGFFEAARRGRAWAWVVAGLAGGLSIFFYPTGRLWCLIAIPFGAVLLLKGPRGTRVRTAGGLAVAALASLLAAGPFLLVFARMPGEFTVRARETGVFVGDNALRLGYVRPEWGTARLLAAQVEHGLGLFNRYPDTNYVWPTQRPLFPPPLAALTLLGLFAATAKPKDPRLLLLALWFWVGFAGVIVTVETPNMHRSATAIPVLGLFAGLALDEIARRIGGEGGEGPRRSAVLGTALAGGTALWLTLVELGFYFGPYARSDGWLFTNVEGKVVAREGERGWAITLGTDAHMVNSGWVRLLAPRAHRFGVPTPGFHLPLAIPANRDLSFLVYNRQRYYLPYLRELYPGGTSREERHPPNELVVTVYHVPLAAWAPLRGALVSVPGAAPVRVTAIGEVPRSLEGRGPMRWSAALRVPRSGNVSFRATGRVSVDGQEILRAAPGKAAAERTVSLPAGDHWVLFESAGRGPGTPVFEWKDGEPGGAWRQTSASELRAVDGPAKGLLGVYVDPQGREQRRLDATLGAMSLQEDMGISASGWVATWRGTLLAPVDGDYVFAFFTNGGTVELLLDGAPAFRTTDNPEKLERARPLALRKGPHDVRIVYRVVHMPAAIDWIWTPPGGEESIVPPSALRPPPDAGPGPPLSREVLATLRWRPPSLMRP